MSEKKHILDWYIDNTPSDEKEYEKGCLGSAIIIAVVFIVLLLLFIFISK